jgi:ribonuclease P protein component
VASAWLVAGMRDPLWAGICAVAPATLKKRKEFLWVRGGRRWSAPAFVLEARARSEAAKPADAPADARFGYTVSKKVGGAVERNRIKRRFRALTAGLAAERMQPGFDYVLIARSPAKDRAFADLKTDLDQALSRVHQAPGQKRRGGHTA